MILLERDWRRAWFPRMVLGAFQALRRAIWSVTTPRTTGVRAVCLTVEGRTVLVRHSYARGWFLPGGSPKGGEDPTAAVLRELREEVGLVAHGTVTELFTVDQRANGKHDRQTICLVRGARIAPRLSLEIEAIGLFDPEALPADVHPSTRYKIERWLSGERGDIRPWPAIAVPSED